MRNRQNLSLRRVLQGIGASLRFLTSIPTLCPHRNRNRVGSAMQYCWDCERVRFAGARGWSVWHRDEVR